MFIYKITNKVNQKYYIGRCKKSEIKELQQRYKREDAWIVKDFFSRNVNPRPINLAIFLYGYEKFEFEIIEDNINDYNLLIKREEFWIKNKNSQNRKIGYNVTPGGSDNNTVGGKKLDISWRKNISRGGVERFKNQKERDSVSKRVAGKNNPMYGISMLQRLINKHGKEKAIIKYEEWKIKLKERTIIPHTKETKQRLSQLIKKNWQNPVAREKRLSSLRKSNNPFFKKTAFKEEYFEKILQMFNDGYGFSAICRKLNLTAKMCYYNFKKRYGDDFKGFDIMINKNGKFYFSENFTVLDKNELINNILQSRTFNDLIKKYKFMCSSAIIRNNLQHYFGKKRFRQLKKDLL